MMTTINLFLILIIARIKIITGMTMEYRLLPFGDTNNAS